MSKTATAPQTTPEEVVDLDQAMKDGLQKFAGELAEAAGDTPPEPEPAADPTPPGPAKDDESTIGGTPAPAGQPKNDEPEPPAAPKADEKSPSAPAGEPEKKDEKKKFRFESHEKAEEGYRHLQRKATLAEQEAARLRRLLEEKEQSEALETERARVKEEIIEYSKTRNQEALDAIDALDAEAEDYQAQVAAILAEKDADINVFAMEKTAAVMPPPATVPDGTPADDGAVPPDEPPAAGDELPPDATVEEAREYMEARVEAAGLDPKDAFFLNASRLVPETDADGNPLTFDQQIDMAIEQTKQYHQTVLDRHRAAQAKKADAVTRETQETEVPLGESGAGPPPKADEPPPVVTLEDAIASAQDERRL